MCRLCGYFLTKRTPKSSSKAKSHLLDLLVLQQTGGTDSTGIGFIENKKNFWVHKQPLPADQFVALQATNDLLDKYSPRCMIAHCRFKTLGDANNNQNNHPHYTKSGIITIHNGVLTNHDELFKIHKLTRDAEVDSEIIGKLVEMFKKQGLSTIAAIQAMSKKVRGSMALSLLNINEPDTLYLVRRENELSIAYDKSSGVIYFATEVSALEDTLIKTKTTNFLGFFQEFELLNRNNFIIQEIQRGTGLEITKTDIKIFQVENPPLQSWSTGYDAGYSDNKVFCMTCHAMYPSQVCKHTSKNEVERLNKSQNSNLKSKDRQIEFWESGIRPGFKVTDRIVKPSKSTTDELDTRMRHLEELEVGEPLPLSQEVELKRILATIIDREYPTLKDIKKTTGENTNISDDEVDKLSTKNGQFKLLN